MRTIDRGGGANAAAATPSGASAFRTIVAAADAMLKNEAQLAQAVSTNVIHASPIDGAQPGIATGRGSGLTPMAAVRSTDASLATISRLQRASDQIGLDQILYAVNEVGGALPASVIGTATNSSGSGGTSRSGSTGIGTSGLGSTGRTGIVMTRAGGSTTRAG